MVISRGVFVTTTATETTIFISGGLDEDEKDRVTSTARVLYCILSLTLQVNKI